MNSAVNLIENLLPLIEEFTANKREASVSDFTNFLTSKTKETSSVKDSPIALFESYGNQEASIAFHLNRLGKYAKYYVKDAFKNLELINADDFGFLAAILERPDINKSELISFNAHEVPSGMEVIKRLIKNGLIHEKTKLDDRRIKVLNLTEKGRSTFFQATVQMEKVAKIVTSQLSDAEKMALMNILNKLDKFHENIYFAEKDYDIDNILEKY
jgi:MarR family transcriptional regulator, lower aerobic nicotinate degradation pathway regulator